jgi:pimeloyl-ACP methyl ester carboxylesterase
VSFDGETVAYSDTGTGPPVILVHGFGGDQTTWVESGLAEAVVAAGRRAIAVDLRGHGGSTTTHDPGAYQDKALARDVIALADHLDLDGYQLVGYSLGASVSGTAALLDQRVRSLVLGGAAERVMDPDWGLFKTMIDGLRAESKALAGNPQLVAMRAEVERRGGDAIALALALEHGCEPLLAPELRSVEIPVLVATGSEDELGGDPGPLAAALPNARLVRPPGDHFSVLRTTSFSDVVLPFLAEASATDSVTGPPAANQSVADVP